MSPTIFIFLTISKYPSPTQQEINFHSVIFIKHTIGKLINAQLIQLIKNQHFTSNVNAANHHLKNTL